MSWEDDLLIASFRGEEFEIRTERLSGGKKGSDHDYPSRDGGDVEDLGNKIRHFIIEAFVTGSDYIQKRDNLEKALRGFRAGELILPTRGKITAIPVSWGVSETVNREGGFARFTIDFAEVEQQGFRRSSLSSSVNANYYIQNSAFTLANSFEQSFSTASSTVALTSAIASFTEAKTTITDAIGFLVTDDFDVLYNTLTTVIDNTLSELLSEDIVTLAYNYHRLISIPSYAQEKFSNVVRAYLGIIDSIMSSYPVTNAKTRIKRNQCSMAELIGSSVAYSLAKSANDATFSTRSDALYAINTLSEVLATIQGYIDTYESFFEEEDIDNSFYGSEDLQNDLKDTISLVQDNIYNTLFSLPAERTIILKKDYTPIELCYELYGTLDKLEQLIDINYLNNPVLIYSGTEITYYV